jgi:hypothetical protein
MMPIASYFLWKKLNREAFLYAMAKNPRHSRPLDETEVRSITAWVNGQADTSDIHLAQSSVRNNLAAKHFLLSLELERAASRSSGVPYRVTRAIMRRINPVSRRSYIEFPRLQSLSNWQYAGAGAIAVVAIVSIMNVNGIFDPNGSAPQRGISSPSGGAFQVAVLTNRNLLNDQTDVVRGPPSSRPSRTPNEPSSSILDFTEFDVPTHVLRNLFMAESQSDNSSVRDSLDAIFKSLLDPRQGTRPRLIFDRELQAKFETGISTNFITLRAYDLENTNNGQLARAIGVTSLTKAFFITYAP